MEVKVRKTKDERILGLLVRQSIWIAVQKR